MKGAGLYFGRALTGLWSRGGRNGRLAVLIYHRVLPGVDPLYPGEPDQDTFRWQMAAVAATCNVLPLTEAVERLTTHSLPPRAVAITFDDGYADNLTQALPVLHEFELPATVFVASGFIDGGIMWNDTVIETLRRIPAGEIDLSPVDLEPARVDGIDTQRSLAQVIIDRLKYLPLDERKRRADELAGHLGVNLPDDLMLTTSQLKMLAAGGIEIGAHTVNHPILSRLSAGQAREEIVGSRSQLEDILRQPVGLFAYPNGRPGKDYGDEHAKMLRVAGFSAAVSTAWAVNGAASDRYQLARINSWDKTPLRFIMRVADAFRRGLLADCPNT
ncbi:MAG TPA: polysaccharide deacetylase family protein [Gammaproteobacteria bacterium]|nr:polysaccharide deacetylase family protein [Gammaproteobacteria bacterium]